MDETLQHAIHWLGRVEHKVDGTHLFHSASGLECQFQGTSIALTASIFLRFPNQAGYFHFEIDGIARIISFLEGVHTQTFTVEPGLHHFKMVKLNEAMDVHFVMKNLTVDGMIVPLKRNPRKLLQVVGASNTTGYGSLGSLAEPKSTVNSNVLEAFSVKLANLLDYDIEIVGASGYGITRGYNTDGVNLNQTIPALYERYGIDVDNIIHDNQPDYPHPVHPELIVLNVGSNDYHSANYQSLPPSEVNHLSALFVHQYLHFLQRLETLHPQAQIIVIYGMMNEGQPIVERFHLIKNQLHQHPNIHVLAVSPAGKFDPFGSDYHPNHQTHDRVAHEVFTYLHSIKT